MSFLPFTLKYLANEIKRYYDNGYKIIMIGHRGHPETIGTMGQLPLGSIDLIQNENEAKNFKFNNEKNLAFVTQTTLDMSSLVKKWKKSGALETLLELDKKI